MTTFWGHVDRSGGPDACWPWRAYITAAGYGQTARGGRHVYAHRRAYQLRVGPIPAGLSVLHRCDNPPCCNPAHLFLGTHADNMADKAAKKRCRTGDFRGERNPNAKLSDAESELIREAYATKRETQAELAARFGVSQGQVSRIVRKKSGEKRPKV